jgi:TetR/AcrR family tetracycline transcriptional repressor
MPRSRRTPLTRERIVEVAIDLLDSEGLNAFSMRRLGAAMGVQAMSLYNHFPDKEGLLDAVTDALLAQIVVPRRAESWQARIVGVCESIRAISLRHPEAFALMATRRSKPARSLPVMEALHQALADAGLSRMEDRVSAYYNLVIFLRGFALFEREYREVQNEKIMPPAEVLAGFSRVAEVAAFLVPVDFERQFRESLDTILRGIERKYSPPSP